MKASILALLVSIAAAAPVFQQGPPPPPGLLGVAAPVVGQVAGIATDATRGLGDTVKGVTVVGVDGLTGTVKGVTSGLAPVVGSMYFVTFATVYN